MNTQNVLSTARRLFGLADPAEPMLLPDDGALLDWLERTARGGRVELARSLLGTGYEIGIHPRWRAHVTSGSLREAIRRAAALE